MTSTQLQLELGRRPQRRGLQDLDDRFEEFHHANPRIYRELVGRARALKQRGYDRLGIRMLWEAMRHDWMLKVDRLGDEFRLNDHYTARYARLIMRQEPDLADVFEIRGKGSATT